MLGKTFAHAAPRSSAAELKGAVAAGHPLTAGAGARMLEEGGNAVDACVAAAFAGAVAESFLTSPAAGGFMLVHRAARPHRAARRLLRGVAGARPRSSRRAGEMDAIDVSFGGDSQTTQPFLIGPATRAPSRGGRGARGRAPRLRAPPVARAARAGDRAGPGRSRADAAAGAHPRDARPDHPPHRRGTPDLQQPERLAARRRRPAPLPRARRDVRGDRPSGRGRALRAASARGRSSRPCATAGETSPSPTSPPTASSGAGPSRVAFAGHEVLSNPPPSSGGVLIAYGLALLERLPGGERGQRRRPSRRSPR